MELFCDLIGKELGGIKLIDMPPGGNPERLLLQQGHLFKDQSLPINLIRQAVRNASRRQLRSILRSHKKKKLKIETGNDETLFHFWGKNLKTLLSKQAKTKIEEDFIFFMNEVFAQRGVTNQWLVGITPINDTVECELRLGQTVWECEKMLETMFETEFGSVEKRRLESRAAIFRKLDPRPWLARFDHFPEGFSAGILFAVAFLSVMYKMELPLNVWNALNSEEQATNTEGESSSQETRQDQKKIMETVLERSLPAFNENTRTHTDNILDPYAVSEYFLGGKFRYVGMAEIPGPDYHGRRIHRFAVIGEKSGFLGRKAKGKEKWATTTLADTINTLLDVKQMNESTLAHWISWLYSRSFGATLHANLIKVQKGSNGLVSKVTYTGKPESTKVLVSVPQVREEDAAIQPGGIISENKEFQPIVDGHGNLLLPSGLSPKHDILVPSDYLKADPSFTLRVNGSIQWDERYAGNLADRIVELEKRVKKAARGGSLIRQAEVFGRTFSCTLMEPLVNRGDELIKVLADYLLKDIPKANHTGRILKLVTFVQELPYVYEYDANFNRDGFLTLFNGGGDCNNLSILFAELMLAAGYDVALLHSDQRKDDWETHVRGGIPAKYFSGAHGWSINDAPDEKWLPIELAGGKEWGVGQPLMGPDMNETVFELEVLRAGIRNDK